MLTIVECIRFPEWSSVSNKSCRKHHKLLQIIQQGLNGVDDHIGVHETIDRHHRSFVTVVHGCKACGVFTGCDRVFTSRVKCNKLLRWTESENSTGEHREVGGSTGRMISNARKAEVNRVRLGRLDSSLGRS